MDFSYYQKYFSPDSIGRYDMAPLYSDPEKFNDLLEDISQPFPRAAFDKIIALDATGFILGASLSVKWNKGLVLVRKGGKIPLADENKLSRDFVDYTGKTKTLELDKKMVSHKETYLIVDDWVETGTQVKAVISMVEELGGTVVGISSIGADRNPETEELFKKYNLHAIGVDV